MSFFKERQKVENVPHFTSRERERERERERMEANGRMNKIDHIVCQVTPSIRICIHTKAHQFTKSGLTTNLQFGMLIPAGIPLLPNPSTSSEVKSGRKNLSFSYSGGQGRLGSSSSALDTNDVNFALISLFTTETKPAERKA